VAVFDVDSERRGTFDAADAAGLERVLAWFAEAPLAEAASPPALSPSGAAH
jgi:putative methionine-R-sulfoxide reductase with GAF domain